MRRYRDKKIRVCDKNSIPLSHSKIEKQRYPPHCFAQAMSLKERTGVITSDPREKDV